MVWWEVLVAVACGVLLVWGALLLVLWRTRPPDLTVREALRLLPELVRLVRRLAADRSLPRTVRWRLWALLAYMLSPVDLVPDVVPVLGYAGAERLRQAWPGSPAGLAVVLRLAGLPAA